jgi:hypothetical protein
MTMGSNRERKENSELEGVNNLSVTEFQQAPPPLSRRIGARPIATTLTLSCNCVPRQPSTGQGRFA